MEEILAGAAVDRGCVLKKNALGLYDITVQNEAGRTIVNERNISFLRAMTVIEENMYQSGRGER